MNAPNHASKHEFNDKSGQRGRISIFKFRYVSKIAQTGPPIAAALMLAALLRLVLAFVVEYVAVRRGTRCLFGDTEIYWQYGLAIAEGRPYVVYQWDVPHFALRTPGYPLWLAVFIRLLGTSTLWIRIGQAGLGTLAVWWIYKLARQLRFSERTSRWAALLLAVDPFQAMQSGFLLTEAVFSPLLLLFLLGWAKVFETETGKSSRFHAATHFFALGAAQAGLALIRPAWGPFLLVLIVVNTFYFMKLQKIHLSRAMAFQVLLLIGWFMVTLPWVVRNERLTGRAAIGGTWGGASLYDGVRPGADGSSEMSFVGDEAFRQLPETEQDDCWKALSWQEIKIDPGRIGRLAIAKQARFWSAWPLERSANRWWLKVICGLIVWPVWLACGFGLIGQRGKTDWRGWVILSLPLVVTALEHTLFVGSSRYRIAVFSPMLIWAAEGWNLILSRYSDSDGIEPD